MVNQEITQADLDRWQQLIHKVIRGQSTAEDRSDLLELWQFLGAAGKWLEELPRLKANIAILQEQIAQLKDPPLEYGIFLGKCPHRSAIAPTEPERELVVGFRGQRCEVKLAVEGVSVDELREGQELVLSKEGNVVGIGKEQSQGGETAEVVNVISPQGTARVLNVPAENEPLRVQWPDGDKFEVNCPAALRQSLHPGDVVLVDESGERAIAKVKPRLHVRSGGNEGIVAEISDSLFQASVDIGDLVRVDTRLQFAFEKLPSYQTSGLTLEEVPDVTYEDIGGLDEQTDAIKDAIELPYIHQKLFQDYQLERPKGILLYGPPGCGKTMIAKAVANSLTQSIRSHLQTLEQKISLYWQLRRNPQNEDAVLAYRQLTTTPPPQPESVVLLQENSSGEEALTRLAEDLQVNDIDIEDLDSALERIQQVLRREDGIRSFFLNVKGPELLNKYVGETENRIRKIFEEARRRATFYTPVVIFFDEMEAMFRTRGSGRSSDVETTIVPQFLAEMDGVEASENILLIGASNRQDMIDPAILRPGRLDIKIKIDPPDADGARAILALHLTPDLPLQPEGLDESTNTVSRLIFQPHIVERTLRAVGKQLQADQLEQIIAAIPANADVRQARDASQTLIQLCADKRIRNLTEAVAQREQLAEAMIHATVDLLFSISSRLEVVTTEGKYLHFPLKDFVSGAVLVSIVSRAKKIALKRQIAASGSQQLGIQLADLETALQTEFQENAEQLVTSQLPEGVQTVEVHLEEEKQAPWQVEKVRIYQAS